MTATDNAKAMTTLDAQTIYQQSLNLQAAAVSQGIQVRALAETEFPRTLRVVNKAGEDVEILIAKKHMNRGEWTTMAHNNAGAVASAANDDWDTIFMRDAAGRRAAVHVPSASEVTVRALSTTPFVSESFRVVCNDQAEDVIAVENRTPRPILVQVTPSVISSGRDVVGQWAEIQPGALKQWTRNDAQMVIVQYDGGLRDAVLAEPASKVDFGGPEPLVIMPIEDTTKIQVTNETKDPIEVQVSNYSGGSKAWFTIAPGASDT
ncbi:YD repeat (two copies) [Allomyces macrogynus ATCC 38327]|uniref:YD repeat (Two copies) n=1 Tax=Allomyces macrogynus (strain ATCC 38327) TaxID=578462 RepID=A0A0L0SMM0_ALLM3|nr:YD repeat (two copies) [Allomyces macrogynus ATCC 38327]|eukprot:KNE63630.1 YD repeat (two copies) [Allomyces macrogynus ATCC 38327]